MRAKTSITLPKETLRAIDLIAGKSSNRSRCIEQAIDAWIAQHEREAREARDLAILNRNAAALNAEMQDALDFQEPM